jgi:hypothetical protein
MVEQEASLSEGGFVGSGDPRPQERGSGYRCAISHHRRGRGLGMQAVSHTPCRHLTAPGW